MMWSLGRSIVVAAHDLRLWRDVKELSILQIPNSSENTNRNREQLPARVTPSADSDGATHRLHKRSSIWPQARAHNKSATSSTIATMSAQDTLKATQEDLDIAKNDAANKATKYEKEAADAAAKYEKEAADAITGAKNTAAGYAQEATNAVTGEYNKAANAVSEAAQKATNAFEGAKDAATDAIAGAEKKTGDFVQNLDKK